jgi:hypothetical protein
MIPIPFKLKTLFVGVGVASIVLIIFLAWRHYEGLIQQVSSLEATKAELTLALSVQQGTVEAQQKALLDWQEAADNWKAEAIRQQLVAQHATAETRRLNAIFAEHDLTRLALAKPGLIERRINAGTARIGRMLSCASGADDCDTNDRSSSSSEAEPATSDSD